MDHVLTSMETTSVLLFKYNEMNFLYRQGCHPFVNNFDYHDESPLLS